MFNYFLLSSCLDSLDFDLYGDLSVDLNQEMTYPEVFFKLIFC